MTRIDYRLFMLLATGALLLTVACTKKEKQAVTTKFQVSRGPLVGKLNWRGIVRSANRIEIRAQSKVKVAKFDVKNFEMVKRGQILIEVDRSEVEEKQRDLVDKEKALELEMSAATVKLGYNAKALDRKRSLFDKGIISKREFEDARRDYTLSENDVKSKQLDIDKVKRDLTEIQDQAKTANYAAPMDGMVSGLLSSDSTSNPEVQAGQLLATVSDPNTLALTVRVEESNIHRLNLGMAAKVILDSMAEEKFSGKVIDISTSAAQNGAPQGNSPMKSYEVNVGFASPKREVREGYTGIVELVYAEKPEALSIPLVALRYLDGKDFVLAAPDLNSEGKPKGVQIGLKTENEAEVLSGLTENEYVVVDAN